MIDLGKVKSGSTIRIPFGSFTGSTGASSAVSNYAAADIQVYKDGNTTARASASGITATTSFNSLVGVNLITIDLSDNTTADFWAAGSEYLVVVGDVTIDSQTVRFPVGRFIIGFPESIRDTTIATLTTQTSFTLTAGSADNNSYVGCEVLIAAAASAIQFCMASVSAYVGASKTVTLAVDPAVYTIAAKDNICIFPRKNVYAVGGTVQTAGDIPAKTNSLTFTVANQVDANALKIGGTTQTAGDIFGTRAEPGQGTPAATASLFSKVDYLYKNWRNRKTQTSTAWKLYGDDAATVDQKATVSDDATTAEKTEIATGP